MTLLEEILVLSIVLLALMIIPPLVKRKSGGADE